MAELSAIEKIRQRTLALRKQQEENTKRIALIPAAKIEATKAAEATKLPATISDLEASLLYEPEELKQLDGFDSQVFLRKLVSIRHSIETRAPGIQSYLQDINKNLRQYPELCHLLNDDQIGAIVQGILYATDTNMAELVVRGKVKKNLTIAEMEAMF